MQRYLQETELLDYSHPAIAELVASQGWEELPVYDRIGAIYDFVQNSIRFGYNASDTMRASQVLQDGVGYCLTKGTLLMALLRRVGVPCRLHGFAMGKRVHRGSLHGLTYRFAPEQLPHIWVEVLHEDEWLQLEGYVLDEDYLQNLQRLFADNAGSFCGYGVATSKFRRPPVAWRGCDTYIQREAIDEDYGVYDAPDDFFAAHTEELGLLARALFEPRWRAQMNANIIRIREGQDPLPVRNRPGATRDALPEDAGLYRYDLGLTVDE